MAEKTVKSENSPKMAKVKLPRLPGSNERQEQYVAVNGKAYIIQRGKEVEVPAAVKEVIDHSELAEDAAADYAEEVALKEPKI